MILTCFDTAITLTCTEKQYYAPRGSTDAAPARQGAFHSLRHHHLDELLIIDLAISVHVCLPNHLINFLICELFAKIGHDMPELGSADEAVAIAVEDLEGLDQFLLRISVLHLPCHQGQELGKIDRSVAVGIDLVDHVLQLSLCRILTQGSHHRSQLLGGDCTIAILVEQGESLLELGNLLFGQLVRHILKSQKKSRY